MTPLEFIDMQALRGDTSDNIPGVPGIGEKTAAKIITEYHSIENAYQHARELKPPRASKAIVEYWDMAVMSKKLAAICVDASLDYDIESARLGNIFTEEAYTLFQNNTNFVLGTTGFFQEIVWRVVLTIVALTVLVVCLVKAKNALLQKIG